MRKKGTSVRFSVSSLVSLTCCCSALRRRVSSATQGASKKSEFFVVTRVPDFCGRAHRSARMSARKLD